MKIVVKTVGVGTPVNPWENHKDYGNGLRMSQSLPALDKSGSPLPVGEYDVELVKQVNFYKNVWEAVSPDIRFQDAIANGYQGRQVYIAKVAPPEITYQYLVNGEPATEKQYYDSKYASNFLEGITVEKVAPEIMKKLISEDEVIVLLVKERERAMKICLSIFDRYKEAEMSKKRIGDGLKLAWVDAERAEIARNCHNAISGRTALNHDEPLQSILSVTYQDLIKPQ